MNGCEYVIHNIFTIKLVADDDIFVLTVGFWCLCSFLAQTGLVSVEDQMQEIGLVPDQVEITKEKSI